MMRLLSIVAAALLSAPAYAQIYTCKGADGSRVFSDQKCGTDAKAVPNITTKKHSPANSATTKAAKVEPKTPQQLQELMQQCNAGDMKACTQWTHGGGPNSLRNRERDAAAACEAGSLADCELRYCSDGATEECRQRVMQAAKVSGDTWYLREEAQQQDDGSILYNVRCIHKDSMEIRDATIACGIEMSPQRCRIAKAKQTYARLDLAASRHCATAQIKRTP